MCRSRACAERSSLIPASRATCAPFAGRATGWWTHELAGRPVRDDRALGRPTLAPDAVRAGADHPRRPDAAAAGDVGMVVLQSARRQRDEPPGLAAGARPARA